MNPQKIRVGITHGDINGIGYEVIIKTFLESRLLELCTPVIYGSPKVAAYHRKALNIQGFNLNHIRSANEIHEGSVNIINCIDENIRVELGKSTPAAGEASFQALEAAVEDLKNGLIDTLVTAPINKDNIQSKDFKFPGHTEYLANSFDVKDFAMMMVSELLRVGIVAGHVPVSQIPRMITTKHILRKLRVINQSLIQDFGIRKPRIAVFGLNPHAGDKGLLGKEEEEQIIPAIEKANEEGILAFGPYPADGFFGSEQMTKFDAVLAMYHDQGLAPFKALCFDHGVNYTAGLPIIRTSPDHGTAYDIAGQGIASPESFREALYLSLDIYRNRLIYNDISKNPLKKYAIDKNAVDQGIDDLESEIEEN